MQNKSKNPGQFGFYSTFEEQLNHQHPLYILTHKINWSQFETFRELYSDNMGRPAKPIRLMVSLLILKHVRNVSDESVVEQWAENAYYQYFSGEQYFASDEPCAATELVHFRNRIGAEGIEMIFKESIRVNGKDGEENQAVVDTTVQEKNITFPTDDKLYKKIIKKSWAIAQTGELDLRQSYKRVLKKLSLDQRFRNHPRNKGKARKADKKVKKEDKNKIYSLHEPHVQCISKGKEHKKYEFGSKVSILTTKTSGVIVGALNMEKNVYDGHTLQPALQQYERITQKSLKDVYADRGYRGLNQIGQTQVHIPKPLPPETSRYQKSKTSKNFRRRAAIEPRIGHLKQDYRLCRNFYKGIRGDNNNVMLAAAAMNFKRMMNIWKRDVRLFFHLFFSWLQFIFGHVIYQKNDCRFEK